MFMVPYLTGPGGLLGPTKLAELVPLSYSKERSTHYSDRLHDFSFIILRCYKDVYINSFFLCTARLRNSRPIECFPLTYNLSDFKSGINRHCRFFEKKFPVCFKPSVVLFVVTPCLIVTVQSCLEWIPIKKMKQLKLLISGKSSCMKISFLWWKLIY